MDIISIAQALQQQASNFLYMPTPNALFVVLSSSSLEGQYYQHVVTGVLMVSLLISLLMKFFYF